MTLNNNSVGQTQRPIYNSETGPGTAAHGRNVDTTVGPFGDARKGAVGPTNGGGVTLSPDSALVGSEVDAAQQALGRTMPIPLTGQTATELVAQADTAAESISNPSNTYLQPLKTFNSVVTTIAQVRPYTQIALGISIAAAWSSMVAYRRSQPGQRGPTSVQLERFMDFFQKTISFGI
ncbi:hypothetical protein F5J12DRAFT_894288 [Pisolithus orientalis]|uniref:uncharacterized protein n=1 Tax=Pisolithus orientalis TaxID=936130 RepID=UPI00222474DB|nr:uncharacterized protein F5J12DRAFT_894288 [Pisolithus orientalis]KAI6002215.1 hypothetical protein F5J12DRAFT_894288 [Pisolithus orientalis]